MSFSTTKFKEAQGQRWWIDSRFNTVFSMSMDSLCSVAYMELSHTCKKFATCEAICYKTLNLVGVI